MPSHFRGAFTIKTSIDQICGFALRRCWQPPRSKRVPRSCPFPRTHALPRLSKIPPRRLLLPASNRKWRPEKCLNKPFDHKIPFRHCPPVSSPRNWCLFPILQDPSPLPRRNRPRTQCSWFRIQEKLPSWWPSNQPVLPIISCQPS